MAGPATRGVALYAVVLVRSILVADHPWRDSLAVVLLCRCPGCGVRAKAPEMAPTRGHGYSQRHLTGVWLLFFKAVDWLIPRVRCRNIISCSHGHPEARSSFISSVGG